MLLLARAEQERRWRRSTVPPRTKRSNGGRLSGRCAGRLAYLDELSPEQLRGLAGTRDRLAILAESDGAEWLQPTTWAARGSTCCGPSGPARSSTSAWTPTAGPLLSAMLAAAIAQDLLTVAAHQQHQPLPTPVLVDEFSAVAPDGIARLFGRGRSAGMSLLLGTQELADPHPPDHPTLAEQVLGNVSILIAHRQVIPDSAEQIAAIAGTRGTWVHTQRTDQSLNGKGVGEDTGTRTRGREFAVHPDEIKQLHTGWRSSPAPAAPNPRSPGCCTPTTHDDRDQSPRNRPAGARLDSPLLKPEQAAELLAVRTSWIYEAVRTNRLPCPRIGRHIRFTREMLEE